MLISMFTNVLQGKCTIMKATQSNCTSACRSFDEDTGSPRAEPNKLLQSKWVIAAVAVAVIGVGLYTFRDTFLAGSINSRLVKVYALLYQVSSCTCISANYLSDNTGSALLNLAEFLPVCSQCMGFSARHASKRGSHLSHHCFDV